MKNYVQPIKIILLSLSLFILLGLSEKDSRDTEDILEGKLICYSIKNGTGILLPEAIEVDGVNVHEIYFDEDVITPFVDRKYMSYSFEIGTIINPKYDRTIPLKLKIKEDSLTYSKEYNRTSAVIDSLLSLDGEDSPVSKLQDEYPPDYYKSVFYTFAYEKSIKLTSRIQDHRFYRDTSIPIVGMRFKNAVDNLLDMGYSIALQGNEYEIYPSYNNSNKENVGD